MENNSIRHEIVSSNPDIDVRFYLSEDSGSYVAPHWHNSLELVYMIEGSMVTQFENNVRQTLYPGEFSIVNPRVIHSVTAQKNKALVLLIAVGVPYFSIISTSLSGHWVLMFKPWPLAIKS